MDTIMPTAQPVSPFEEIPQLPENVVRGFDAETILSAITPASFRVSSSGADAQREVAERQQAAADLAKAYARYRLGTTQKADINATWKAMYDALNSPAAARQTATMAKTVVEQRIEHHFKGHGIPLGPAR